MGRLYGLKAVHHVMRAAVLADVCWMVQQYIVSIERRAGPSGCVVCIQEYRLTYRVFDDKFENSTTLVIQVLDVNDNPPRFDQAVYNVLDLNEEEPGISKSNPKYLLTVRSALLYFMPHRMHSMGQR